MESELVQGSVNMDQQNTIKQEVHTFENGGECHNEIKIEEVPIILDVKQEIGPQTNITITNDFYNFSTMVSKISWSHNGNNCNTSFTKTNCLTTSQGTNVDKYLLQCNQYDQIYL